MGGKESPLKEESREESTVLRDPRLVTEEPRGAVHSSEEPERVSFPSFPRRYNSVPSDEDSKKSQRVPGSKEDVNRKKLPAWEQWERSLNAENIITAVRDFKMGLVGENI
jgi:hypothetical protein